MLVQAVPVLREIVAWHVAGTRYGIDMDPDDGLLRAGESDPHLTWMDAKLDGWGVTPRRATPSSVPATSVMPGNATAAIIRGRSGPGCWTITRWRKTGCIGTGTMAQARLEPIRDHWLDAGLGTISEIFAGAPHHPRSLQRGQDRWLACWKLGGGWSGSRVEGIQPLTAAEISARGSGVMAGRS